MKSEVIDIYYFTGTGNTLVVVKKLANELAKNGKEVNLYRVEKSDPKAISKNHVIGLAFPVAVFSTYPFVWQFINALPLGHGAEIFMLDTLGGFSGGIVGPLKKVLMKKGYKVIGAAEFIMPSNYGSFIPSKEKCNKKIAKAEQKAIKYARQLLEGKSRWLRIPLLSDVVRLLSRSKYPWQSMGKRITVDYSRCSKCGTCAKLCPVNNITMQNYPKQGGKCIGCMRCIAFCPRNAILYRGKNVRYSAVKMEDIK